MFISRKRMEAVENRLADLEKRVQGRPTEIASALLGYGGEQMSKSDPTRHQGSGETDMSGAGHQRASSLGVICLGLSFQKAQDLTQGNRQRNISKAKLKGKGYMEKQIGRLTSLNF